VKRQIHACLYEVRLYNDDVALILRAQAELLRHNLSYLRLSATPMLWMIVPFVLVIAQLQFHYGYAGLEPGQRFVVKAGLREGWESSGALGPGGARPAASLEAPPGLEVETPPVWIPAQRELAWRVRAREWGDHQLALRLGERDYTKRVQVSRGVHRRSPLRLEPGLLNGLLYPAEEPLPEDSPVSSIAVGYREASVSVLGWSLDWMLVFFGLSVLFAFALRGRLGVTL
jgi:hypothetical protein